MIGPVHHIGVAVRSLDAALAFYRTLGLEPESIEEVRSQGVRVAFLPAGPVRVEILESLAPDGVIAKFIGRRGEGLHHLAFRVDREEVLHEAAASLRQAGVTIEFGPGPARTGTHMLFPDPDGIRLELFYEPGKNG